MEMEYFSPTLPNTLVNSSKDSNISMEGKFSEVKFMKDSFKVVDEKAWEYVTLKNSLKKGSLMMILSRERSSISMVASNRRMQGQVGRKEKEAGPSKVSDRMKI